MLVFCHLGFCIFWKFFSWLQIPLHLFSHPKCYISCCSWSIHTISLLFPRLSPYGNVWFPYNPPQITFWVQIFLKYSAYNRFSYIILILLLFLQSLHCFLAQSFIFHIFILFFENRMVIFIIYASRRNEASGLYMPPPPSSLHEILHSRDTDLDFDIFILCWEGNIILYWLICFRRKWKIIFNVLWELKSWEIYVLRNKTKMFKEKTMYSKRFGSIAEGMT